MPSKKPNIIFILSDDHGVWCTGCYGNTEVKTPHIDALAQQGMRFDNFFCASPVCSPARASILTGRMPSAHGVQDWIKGGSTRVNPIAYLEGQDTYTQLLADNNYVCDLSGKWHLGSSFTPQCGFSHWYAHMVGSGNYYNAPMVRDGELEYEKEYVTDAITDDAIAQIEKRVQEDKPFYLSVHYTAPHDPWVGDNHPKKYTDLYQDCTFESCQQEPKPHPDAVYPYNEEDARASLIGYYAAVTGMDEGIGRIVETVDRLGIREDTLIIYTADNGFNCGQHGVWGKGNGTFSFNMYEESIKVPFVISQPGRIPANSVCDRMVSQYDIFQTLLDWVGITHVENGQYQPGASFAPALEEKECAQVDAIYVYDEYGPCRMVRTRAWKYIHRYPFGPHELYHLESDPQERVNLYDDPDCQERVRQMRGELYDWFYRYVDPKMDGAREPVKGNGQLCRPGVYANGALTFDQNRTVVAKPYPRVGPSPDDGNEY